EHGDDKAEQLATENEQEHAGEDAKGSHRWSIPDTVRLHPTPSVRNHTPRERGPVRRSRIRQRASNAAIETHVDLDAAGIARARAFIGRKLNVFRDGIRFRASARLPRRFQHGYGGPEKGSPLPSNQCRSSPPPVSAPARPQTLSRPALR